MPKAQKKEDTPQAENPRFAAMKSIVQNRLDSTQEGSGEKSLREVLAEQDVSMADPNAEIEPEIKDSDSHANAVKDVSVDMESAVFTPDEEMPAKAAEPAAEPEPIQEASPEPAETPVGTEPAAPEASQEAQIPVYERGGRYFTKIKVNGEEQEIALDQLKASAQKDNASRERFEAAARKEQDLATREAAIAAREANAIPISAPAAPTPAQPAANVGDTVNELYDSLAYEDEETVKAKLAAVVSGQAPAPEGAPEDGRGSPSTQQPADIQAEINAALERRDMNNWESARQAALAQWEVDYADVAIDTDLREIANMRTKQLANAHPEKLLSEVMNEAGDFARNWRDTQNPQAAPATQTPEVKVDNDRSDRKRSAPAPVKTNSSAASKSVEEEKPMSRGDVVAEIRAARGQPAG